MQNLLPVFNKTLETVCGDWDDNHSKKWGFTIDASRKSISRTHFFVSDLLTANPALPTDPGPFKMAAAFLVSGMHFIQFSFFPLQGATALSESEQLVWKSRFMFKAIPVFLLQLKLTETGKKLGKIWDAPTIHYRLDFLNFIRWCEFPLLGPSSPPPPNIPSVNMVRLNRLIMATTLIIEACYYLSENEVKCDVKNRIHITPGDIDDISRTDLYFDCRE
jgi:hypothetical protein